MDIHYPNNVNDIPPDRNEELEKEIVHFLRLSPCERIRYVEKEWSAIQDYIKRFGILWNRKSS